MKSNPSQAHEKHTTPIIASQFTRKPETVPRAQAPREGELKFIHTLSFLFIDEAFSGPLSHNDGGPFSLDEVLNFIARAATPFLEDLASVPVEPLKRRTDFLETLLCLKSISDYPLSNDNQREYPFVGLASTRLYLPVEILSLVSLSFHLAKSCLLDVCRQWSNLEEACLFAEAILLTECCVGADGDQSGLGERGDKESDAVRLSHELRAKITMAGLGIAA